LPRSLWVDFIVHRLRGMFELPVTATQSSALWPDGNRRFLLRQVSPITFSPSTGKSFRPGRA